MVRGTTPTHVFEGLPIVSSMIEQIWITYLQAGAPVLTKNIDAVTFQDDSEHGTCSAQITLSQEETLLFVPGRARIQLRLLLKDGTALASCEVTTNVKRILEDGIIT